MRTRFRRTKFALMWAVVFSTMSLPTFVRSQALAARQPDGGMTMTPQLSRALERAFRTQRYEVCSPSYDDLLRTVSLGS